MVSTQDAERALAILAEPCKLALPLPRREGEVQKTPSIDALADAVLVDGMTACNVGGQRPVRPPERTPRVEGYSGF